MQGLLTKKALVAPNKYPLLGIWLKNEGLLNTKKGPRGPIFISRRLLASEQLGPDSGRKPDIGCKPLTALASVPYLGACVPD